MHVLITGAEGFLARKLANELAREGNIGGTTITKLTLVDVLPSDYESPTQAPFSVNIVKADVYKDSNLIVTLRPDIIFHMAVVPADRAEDDVHTGYFTNVDGTRALLESIRTTQGYKPRLVLSSSILSLDKDGTRRMPHTSFGTEKAISELLLEDYSRRGFVDGIAIRLPVITVRPGDPNGDHRFDFLSSLVREPLRGIHTVCPVSMTTLNYVASPRSAVRFLIHAAQVPPQTLACNERTVTMPGLVGSVFSFLDSLSRVTGAKAVELIRVQPNYLIQDMVSQVPCGPFDLKGANELGFVLSDDSFDDIISAYIYDELGGHKYSLSATLMKNHHTTKLPHDHSENTDDTQKDISVA
jgi:nucleoside-diphosphate-sugar epimerase